MMIVRDWNIKEITGYKPITTFYTDFSIAEKFGMKAVEDTFKRAFNEWKSDYKYLTELVMVLNWKAWEHCESNTDVARAYCAMWEKADRYAVNNLKGEELRYFYRVTD